MGLNPIRNEGGSTIYLQIIEGQLRQKVKEGTPNAESRVNKKGDTVWELVHGSLTGSIQSVDVRYNDVLSQNELIIILTDVGEVFKITLPLVSDFAQNFIDRLPNIPTGTVYMRPYCFEDKERKDKEGKPKLVKGISVHADSEKGQKIERFFTKDNILDKPQWKDGMSKKELAVWKIDTEEFYANTAKKYGAKFLNPKSKSTPKTAVKDDDDLPF